MRFTVHAVEQYVARCQPELSYPVALAQLREHVSSATPTRERSAHGDEVFLVPPLHCRLVVKRERGQLIVTTVLAADGPPPEEPPPRPPDPMQARRDALHALRNYLDGRAKHGDRKAERIHAALRNTGVL